jgi:SAM-dependent methyltransferase
VSQAASVADHWADRDVYGLIVSALERASKSLDSLTVEDLAPVDHFHARGFPATVDLADRLSVEPEDHLLDIGCGVGGPARYFAQRFGCKVSGIDITGPFVEAANKLTALLDMDDQVFIEQGDGERLPYDDGSFDGAYAQHVTMNVADRKRFFAEAWRVLKPGGSSRSPSTASAPWAGPTIPCPGRRTGRASSSSHRRRPASSSPPPGSWTSRARTPARNTWPRTALRSRSPIGVTCRRSAYMC